MVLRQAKRRKYHFIYKTTCKVTGNYYIGMHSTDDLEDGYVGSGKRLWHSINKHGKENHVCEIVEFLPDRDALKVREAELVSSDALKDEKCMNLVVGGQCGNGWMYVNGTDKHNNKGNSRKTGNYAWKDIDKTDPEYRKSVSDGLKKLYESGYENPFKGKQHTAETKKKISKINSVAQAGSRNSQYGSCWVTNGNEAKKIKSDELDAHIQNGWRKGRKLD